MRREVGGHNSTWAIAAIVASVDPQMDMAARRIEFGLAKVAELLFGCIVGLAVSWLMSRLWPMPLPQPQPAGP